MSGGAARTMRGFALIVALIALAAMSAAAAMLERTVDTATAVTASLVLRLGTIAATDAALEQAIAALAGGTIADRDRDDPAQGYYAARQPGEDARAIPRPLQQSSTAGVARIGATEGTTFAYVIERMCLAPGPVSDAQCALYRTRPPSPAPPSEIYRVSVRADGPQQASVLVQATVRGATPPRRVSWRIVTD